MTDIRQQINEWFLSNTTIDIETIKNNSSSNYFEQGWLDSLAFIQLVAFLEETFNISLTTDDFENEEFLTIDGLVNIVSSRS